MPKMDFRGWVATGLFAFSFYLVHLLADNPRLAAVPLFATVTQGVILTGLISGVVAFLYGTSKGSAEKDKVIAAAVNQDEPK